MDYYDFKIGDFVTHGDHSRFAKVIGLGDITGTYYVDLEYPNGAKDRVRCTDIKKHVRPESEASIRSATCIAVMLDGIDLRSVVTPYETTQSITISGRIPFKPRVTVERGEDMK